MAEKPNLPKYIFDWKGVAAFIGGYFFSSLIIAGISVVSLFLFHKNLQYSDVWLVIGNAVVFSTIIFAFDYFVCRPSTGKKLNFNFSTTNFYTYLLIFPMMLGMMFISEFLSNLLPTSGLFWGKMYKWFSEMMNMISQDFLTMLLMTVIFAPIFEEIIFRGIIQKGMINGGMNPKKAIWISAVIFGLVHGNPWQFVGAVLLGFVLGTVYERTKSLLLPMLLHGFNNLCSTLLITFTKKENFAHAFNLPEWFLLIIGIVIFGTFYFLFTKKYRVHYS